MPAVGIRCLMKIQDDVYSIQEAHVALTTDFASAKNQFIVLFKARMALCGPPALPFVGRMTLLGANRVVDYLSAIDLATVNTVPNKAQMQDNTGVVGPNTSDQPKSCILLKATGAGNRIKSIYLAGVPDPVISEDPRGPRVAFIPTYAPLFDTYARILSTGGNWGYIARVTDPTITLPKEIVGLTTNMQTLLTGVVIVGNAASYPANKAVMVRNVKMSNNAYLSYAGQHVVDSSVADTPVSGQATIYLRGTVGVNIGEVLKRGTIEFVDYTTVAYTNVFPFAQTTRKRGNRSLVGPGRRLTRRKISL